MSRQFLHRVHLPLFLLAMGSEPVLAQQDSLIDLFPLEVGKEFIYSFTQLYSSVMGGITRSDTGSALVRVVAVAVSPDSIRWQFARIRDFQRYDGYSRPTYSVHDSIGFEIVERTSGYHELITPYSLHTAQFPFWTAGGDSVRFYRYSRDSTCSVLLAGCGCGYFVSMSRDVIFRKDVGVVASVGELIGPTIVFERWAYYQDVTTGVEDQGSSGVPTTVALNPNFPNPFNPSTTISFALPARAFVTVGIYDMLGREIAVLVSEELPPGRHMRTWSAFDRASGVYLCQMRTGTTVLTQKVVLVR